MEQVDALIFDCDGVLINSEEIVQDIELQLLADHGLHYQREEFSLRFLGVSNQQFYRELNHDSMQRLGVPLAQDFETQLHSRARENFESELRAFADIHLVVEPWIDQSKPLAVASSSSIEGLEFKLSKTDLKKYFAPHIYSAEHVEAGKPDPAIYLHTASKLDVAPERCVVLEDSVNGVVAAKAAGMFVIGFIEGNHCVDGHDQKLNEAGAEFVVESMQELKAEILRRDWF